MGGGRYTRRLAAPAKQSALGHLPKGAAVKERVALPGFSGILKCI